MQAMQAQVQAVTEELGALKMEIINLKESHAGLHQSSVDSHAQTSRTIEAIQARVAEIPSMATGKRPTLMEAKQVKVRARPKAEHRRPKADLMRVDALGAFRRPRHPPAGGRMPT